MRRRHLFPAILLGASALWSMVAAFASTPTQSYDYLDALVVDERYAPGTIWQDVDIRHSDKLSDQDATLFMQMVEAYDMPSHENYSRALYLDQAQTKLEFNKCEAGTPCNVKIHLNRVLEPTLIHGDLRLVQLRENALTQTVAISDDRLEFGDLQEEARILRFMLTERGWVMKSAEQLSETTSSLMSTADFASAKISGLNYYPALAPWDRFWAEFPVEDIERDLDEVKQLGANAVRIFVQHEYFANLETQDDGLEKLRTFLDLCEARNIKVIVTLFDLRADYRLQNWSRDSVHLNTILETVHDHTALLAIDLKNQPDLDFEASGEELVKAWLSAMICSARQTHADLPLTIGWSDPAKADWLSDRLDLVSFHDYNTPEGLSTRYQTVKENVGDKPVFITEIGHSRWSLTGEKVDLQAERLTAQLSQLSDADGVFIWTLNDFEHVGSNIVGHRPWRKAQQETYGLKNSEGTWLPSAFAFQNFNADFIPVNSASHIPSNTLRRLR